MNKKTFGYIRVSAKDQNIARQMKDMMELGIEERDIFIDKQSGKNFDRPNYLAMKRFLREGDLLYVKSIDRFGRNSKEIKREWEDITVNLKADIRVIDMPLLDTTLHKDLLGTFVSDVILQTLSFVAEMERDNSKKRQREGIDVAQAMGKHLGRPKKDYASLSANQKKLIEELYPKWQSEEITAVSFMQQLGLKRSTFYNIINQYSEGH